VTDDLDRRCLMAILARFVCQDCVETDPEDGLGYRFSSDGVYYVPLSNDDGKFKQDKVQIEDPDQM